MGLVRKQARMDVVQAAHRRVRNIFATGKHVYMSLSGGKDSICMANVVYEEIQAGNVDPKQLSVIFIDEEAMYPDVIRIVEKWRKTFQLIGARFYWLCLEIKHFNCFNNLANDETFVCWDRNKEKDWIRPLPDNPMQKPPRFRPGRDNYQQFMERVTANGVQLVGLRVAESVQRLFMFSQRTRQLGAKNNKWYPIYDWKDNDVWLYIKEKGLDFPVEYLYLWQVGVNRRMLRISQFFSVDSAGALVRMNEFYPDLMERICRREPNAYLAALYWDSEMFRRKKAGKGKGQEEEKDYKAEVYKLLSNIDQNFQGKNERWIAGQYKNQIFLHSHLLREKNWKELYKGLIAGDPKRRVLRATMINAQGNKK